MTSQQSTAETQPRVIRVFVSSTFRDMQSERDELVKYIFPQLHKLCEKRSVTWGEVDLHWGITDEYPLCTVCRPASLDTERRDMEQNALICPKCGGEGICHHRDVGSAEIYLTRFEFECLNPACGYQDSTVICCGHAGENWEIVDCPYCGEPC